MEKQEQVEAAKLDAEVAEKIMGWPKLEIGQMEPLAGYWDRYYYIEVRYEDSRGDWPSKKWSPSTDIKDAFDVVAKMKEREYEEFGVWWVHEDQPGDGWHAWFGYNQKYKANGLTAAEAICNAALTALRSK